MRTLSILSLTLGVALACESAPPDAPLDDATASPSWRHVQTVRAGAADNSEVVKMLADGEYAILVASKARKLTLLRVTEAGLAPTRTVSLFTEDGGESELTHVDLNAQETFAAVTRTIPQYVDGELVACGGALVFVDISDTERFGTILSEVEVGPMPDAVDISGDDRWAVTADEVDYNDGKCPLSSAKASVTVIELPSGDPTQARVRAQITMVDAVEGLRREPEQAVFGPDDDQVAVTLQDTHEVLLFRVSAVVGAEDAPMTLTTEGLTIIRLPNRSTGAEPWPDGVIAFTDARGDGYFAVAGEYNDTFTVLSLGGTVVAQVELQQSDFPSDLPRNLEDWSHAPFRPDSVTAFEYAEHRYLAFSLKHAGAVGVWRVDDVHAIELVSVVKVGDADAGTPTTESSIGTEGISANRRGQIVTANEGESSISLVAPLGR
jgi:hypothetical protein